MLSYGGQYLNRELVGSWHITANKLYVVILQAAYKSHVTAQAIQFGNDKRGILLSELNSFYQFRSISFLARFDLHKLSDDPVPVIFYESIDRFALSVQPLPRPALLG